MRQTRRYRSHAFIDKISITVPVSEELWEISTENMMEASHLHFSFKLLSCGIERDSYQIYRFAWKLQLQPLTKPDVFIYVQALPSDPRTGFLRLEWNPAKSPKDSFNIASELFERLIPNFREFLMRAMITRIDISTDVRHIRVTDLHLFTNSAKTQCTLYRQNQGVLNGCELGVPKSPRRLIVYDKRFERECKGRPMLGGHSSPLTRIEFRILRIGRVNQIESFRNQLEGFSVTLARKAMRIHGSEHWIRFLANCDRFGAQIALSRYPPEIRAQYRRLLKGQCQPEWYDSTEIWREGMRHLRQIVGMQTALN